MEKKVFISYRRADSAGYSGRLYDYLVNHFGKDRIFMDVVAIKPGVDFVQEIENTLDKADAVIVVIGNSWLDIRGENGERRLDDPNDFVRLEVETSLKLEIPVVPVLIQNSQMPDEKDLPISINELAKRNALRLSDDHWESDINYLTHVLELSFNISGSLVQQSTKRYKKWVVAAFIFSTFFVTSSLILDILEYRNFFFFRTRYYLALSSVIISIVLLGLLFRFAEENSKLLSYIILGIGGISVLLVSLGFDSWSPLSNLIVLGLLNFVEFKHR